MIRQGHVSALVLSICAASMFAAPQKDSFNKGRLNPRIGAAAPERCKVDRQGKGWKNPSLGIHGDGISVRVGRNLSDKMVAVADLEQTLLGLPVKAWPCGRLIAVQEASIAAADGSDRKAIKENLVAALTILKALNVTVEHWTS